MDSNQLKTELASVFDEFKKANDKAIEEAAQRSGTATAETRTIVDKLNTEITSLKQQLVEFEKRSGRPPKEGKDGKVLTPEMELRSRAYEKYVRYGTGESTSAAWTPEEIRALSASSDADGQFLAPDDFEANIIMGAFDLAEIRPLCQVGTTSRDNVKLGSLSKPIVGWGTSGLAVDQQTLESGGISIPIHNVRALTLLSNDTLDDSAADVMSQLETAFEFATAEAEDDAFAVNTDPKGPSGILSNSSVLANYTLSKVAAAISDSSNNGMDALKTMFYALKKTYRRNSTWLMNSATEAEFRKLVDGNGRYLWDYQVAGPAAGTLFGRPLINPEGMPDVGAGAFPVILGDLRAGYKIRDRSGLTIKRLTERYAEYDQTAFLLKKRVGGQVALAEAFRVLKIAAS